MGGLLTLLGGGGSGPGGQSWPDYLASVAQTGALAAKGALTSATDIAALTSPEERAYIDYINQLTETADPNLRMQAVAPNVADITAQSEAAKKSISNLPRGGARDYALAQADITKASDIGKTMSSVETLAQQEKGRIGQQGIQDQLGFMNVGISGLEGIASIGAQQQQVGVQKSQATQQAIAQIIMALVMA